MDTSRSGHIPAPAEFLALGAAAGPFYVAIGVAQILAREGFDWWCEAGANHHLALTPGHHGAVLRAFADVHGIEFRLRDQPFMAS